MILLAQPPSSNTFKFLQNVSRLFNKGSKRGNNPSLVTLDVIALSYHLQLSDSKAIPQIHRDAPHLWSTALYAAAPPDHSLQHRQHCPSRAPPGTGSHQNHGSNHFPSTELERHVKTPQAFCRKYHMRSKTDLDFTNNNQYLCPVALFFSYYIEAWARSNCW